jgi:hypothetical protein
MRWGLAGFVVGLAVAALAVAIREARQAPAREAAAQRLAQAEAAAKEAEAAAAGAGKRFETALEDNEMLRKGLKEMDAELKAARAAGPASGPAAVGGAPPPRPRKSLKELAAELARWNERLRGKTWDTWPKEARELQEQVMAAMQELAEAMGVSVQEAMRSPDGMSLLLLELLAQSVPPLDAAQEAKLRELLAAEKPAWDAWREAKAGMSALEGRRKFLDLAGGTRDAFFAALTEDQRATVSGYGLFDQNIQGSQTWFDGPKAAVTKALADQWASTLSLDEKQAAAVAPIVEDYVRLSRELNDSIWNRRYAGEDLTREEDYALRLDLMIATQKRIAEAALLTTEQEQAMKEWQFTYGVNVTDDAGK